MIYLILTLSLFESLIVVTCETSSIVIEDIGELSDFFVRRRKRIVRITGVHGCVRHVQEHRSTGVVRVDQSHRFLRENVRGILAVQVPGRFHAPSHVQAPVRLNFYSRFHYAIK